MITIYGKHQLNCLHFSSEAITDLQVLLFNIHIWIYFQLFFISYDNGQILLNYFRFNLFNLPIDHLHKLISPLSIEFIRMTLRLHYVCIAMYCDIFASGLLFTETTKKVWIKLIQCCHNNHWKTWIKVASYFLEKWGKCKYLHSQIVPLGEGLLRTPISSMVWISR